MSAAISPSTGKLYEAKRVSEAFEVLRSSFYDRIARRNRVHERLKRGPKTPISDDALPEHVRTDLATSLFDGEGNRKVLVRMDNGSQLLSDHFLIQIKFWGMARIFAFVSQPQTNAVAERFYRTLKERIIW